MYVHRQQSEKWELVYCGEKSEENEVLSLKHLAVSGIISRHYHYYYYFCYYKNAHLLSQKDHIGWFSYTWKWRYMKLHELGAGAPCVLAGGP